MRFQEGDALFKRLFKIDDLQNACHRRYSTKSEISNKAWRMGLIHSGNQLIDERHRLYSKIIDIVYFGTLEYSVLAHMCIMMLQVTSIE